MILLHEVYWRQGFMRRIISSLWWKNTIRRQHSISQHKRQKFQHGWGNLGKILHVLRYILEHKILVKCTTQADPPLRHLQELIVGPKKVWKIGPSENLTSYHFAKKRDACMCVYRRILKVMILRQNAKTDTIVYRCIVHMYCVMFKEPSVPSYQTVIGCHTLGGSIQEKRKDTRT